MTGPSRYATGRSYWLAMLLLFLLWARLVHTATVKSDTFDEMFHILHGVLYWQHTPLEPVVQNPPLVSALIGLPVILTLDPALPLEHPTWSTGNWLRIAQAFLWEENPDGLEIIWVGRVAVISLAVLLGAVLFRWASRAARSSQPLAGVLVLFLYSFDPNILAHGALATGDLGAAFFLTLAAYSVWRYWRLADMRPGWPWQAYLLAALAIGAALAAKFSAVILIPALAIMVAFRWFRLQPNLAGLRRGAAEFFGWLFISALFFLLIYRFDLAALAADFSRQLEHQRAGHSAFLLGELSLTGWWYYFPFLFTVKTPLPALVLFAGALVDLLRRWRTNWSLSWPILVAGGIGAASLLSRVNIGYRYLLPALPLLYLAVGQWLGRRGAWSRQEPRKPAFLLSSVARQSAPLFGALLLVWAAVESLLIHPDYLAYFNQVVGGPENGWRVAVDSNLDWGQDVGLLADYLAEKPPILPVYAAWFGTSPLTVHGVNAIPLPAWPVASEELLYSGFYPPRPGPGYYVLSATQLQGVYLSDPNRFAWFRRNTPSGRAGYSLFLYDVPSSGPPVALALSGIGLATMSTEDFDEAFASNDVRLRWYDARTALVWPAGERGRSWAVAGEGHLPTHPMLQALYPLPTLAGEDENGMRYRLFHLPKSLLEAVQDAGSPPIDNSFDYALPAVEEVDAQESHRRPLLGAPVFDGVVELLGYQTDGKTSSGAISVLSYWRVVGEVDGVWPGLKVFLHLLDDQGQVAAQHDALDIRVEGLRIGDEIAQLHQLLLPSNPAPGNYRLQIGVYDAQSGKRLSVATPAGAVDRLLLRSIAIP